MLCKNCKTFVRKVENRLIEECRSAKPADHIEEVDERAYVAAVTQFSQALLGDTKS